jgi:hypothetical protein
MSEALAPVGIALAAVRAMLSLFDNAAERRHKEMMEKLRKLGGHNE